MSFAVPCKVKPFTNDHKLYKPINGYWGGVLVNEGGDKLGFYGHEHAGTISIHFEKWEFDTTIGWVRRPRVFKIDPKDYQAFLDMLVQKD